MSNRKRSITVVLMILAVSVGIIVFSMNIQGPRNNNSTVSINSSEESQASTATMEGAETATIASKWQWQETNGQAAAAATNEENSLPFTPQSVHDALQAVKVDENGNIILDHDALISLDEALERIHNRLDSDSLLKLQDIIKSALPDKVGEQTAQLVEDYKGFLDAKEQFSQIHEGLANANAVPTVSSITSDQALYGELQDLRELHLGRQTANKLFHDSDANAEYMFESMKLGLDKSLSAEEIAARRREIEERHRKKLGDSVN